MAAKDDVLKILILGSLDIKTTTQEINNQLKSIKLDLINLKFNIDLKTIKDLAKQINDIKKLGNQKANIIDPSSLNPSAVKNLYTSIKQVTDKYKEMGEVKVNKNIDAVTNTLKGFTLELKRADGIMEQLKFKTVQIADGEKTKTRYLLDNIKIINQEQAIREKQLQLEQRIKEQVQKQNQQQIDQQQKLLHSLTQFQDKAKFNADRLLQNFGKTTDKKALQDWLNEVEKLNVKTPKLQQEINKLSERFRQLSLSASDASKKTASFGEQLEHAFSKIALWGTAGGIFFGVQRGIQELFSTIVEIDTKLTELSKVLSNDTDFTKLMQDTSQLANTYGRSLTEAQDALVEFGKAGYEANEALKLTNATLLGANVTGLKTAEMANYLTGALIQFNLTAEESTRVVDRINEVDNNFSVTSLGLAQSIAKAGESAQAFGVTIDELIGMTTAISQATRESGNVIGNSMKTVFARLNMDGTQDALASVGVAVKDVNGELRSATSIYSDVALKWDSMSRAQRTYVAEALAGKYHITRMMALLDNWGTVTRATETSQNSLGSSMEENRKHMQSLASAIEKVKTAGQELAFTIGKAGLRDAMYSVLTSVSTFIKGVTSLDDSATGTTVALASLVATVTAFRIGAKGAITSLPLLSAAFAGATNAVKGFTLALMRNPLGLLAVGLATATTAIISYIGAQKELNEEVQKLDQSASQANESLKQIEETLSSIGGTKKQDILDYDKTIENLEQVKQKLNDLVKAEQEYIDHAKELDPNFSLNDVGLDPDNISQELKDLAQTAGVNILSFNSLGEAITAVNNKLAGMKDVSTRLKENDLTSFIGENGEKIKILTGLLNDQKNGLELNQGALSKLKDLGVDYNEVLEEQNGKINVNISNTTKLKDALTNAVNARITELERETAAEEKALIAFLASMNIKISKIEEFSLVNGQMNAELNKQANSGNADALRFAGGAISRSAGSIKKAKDDLLEYKTLFQSLKSEGQLGSGEKKKTDSVKSASTQYTPLTEQAKQLLQIETELEVVQAKRQQLASTSQPYRDNLQEEKKLLQDKIALLQQEYDTVTKTQKIGGKSNKIGGSTKDSDESLKRASDLQQQIIKLQGDLSNLSFDQVNSSIEEYAEKNQYLDGQLKRVEASTSSLSSTTEEYRDALKEEISLLQLKQENLHYEAELIREQLANGNLSAAQQTQLKKKLQNLGNEWLELNNNIKSKNIEVSTSAFEEQNQIIDQLNDTLEQTKSRMSGLVEGSDDYNNSISQQNALLVAMRTLTEQQIATTLKEIQLVDKKSPRYQVLISQLNGLRSAQIGYNNALRENQALKWDKINEKFDKNLAKEIDNAREIRNKIIESLKKLISPDEIEFDPEAIKSKAKEALLQLKNLHGGYKLNFGTDAAVFSYDDLEKKVNEYVNNIEDINKKTQDFIRNSGGTSDTIDIIKDEAKYAATIKNEIKEQNKLLEQTKAQHEQIQQYIQHQIDLLAEERDKIVASLREQMEVPVDIDWEKLKDDLVDFGQSGKIVIGDVTLDLDNATVIGDVPSDVSAILQDIVSSYAGISNITKEFDTQKANLTKQAELRNKLLELESKGKKETEEYTKLKKELTDLDSEALEARKKLEESIQKEVEMLKGLREEERQIREEIQERETVYKRQIDAIDKQIESTKKLYDDQIKAQQEKLELFDEENDKIDRQIERTKLLQELENARKDKRFEYINEQGQVELTYDKGKVAELEQKLAEFDLDTQRKDARKQLEDSIKDLEKARDDELNRLEEYKSNLKETHDAEIAQLNFYLNQNKLLQDKLTSNINKHIADLESAFNKEIDYRKIQLEELKIIQQAELDAMAAYVTGLEDQLKRVNDDIGGRIDALGDRFDSIIERFAKGDIALGNLVRDFEDLAKQVSSIKLSAPSPSAFDTSGYGDLKKHHVGDIVGGKSTTPLTKLANKIFNTKPDETVVKSLIGELQIPPKNIANNFIPAMQTLANHVGNIVMGRNTTPTLVSQDQYYTFSDVTIKANNPSEFWQGINHRINARKK